MRLRQVSMLLERVLLFYSGVVLTQDLRLGLLLMTLSIAAHWIEYEWEFRWHRELERLAE
jgi:hypothetical protein